jgi:hypothetical protein
MNYLDCYFLSREFYRQGGIYGTLCFFDYSMAYDRRLTPICRGYPILLKDCSRPPFLEGLVLHLKSKHLNQASPLISMDTKPHQVRLKLSI